MKNNENYNLYLDDFRDPIDSSYYLKKAVYTDLEWTVVRNFDEFVKTITENGVPNTISFDHDLASIHYEQQENIDYSNYHEETGYDCAKWLIVHCINNNLKLPKTILVHSMNPVGAENIKSLFNTYL